MPGLCGKELIPRSAVTETSMLYTDKHTDSPTDRQTDKKTDRLILAYPENNRFAVV